MSFTETLSIIPANTKSFGAVALPRKAELPQAMPQRQLPSVSVVIPCREDKSTIRAAVDSILGQDYSMLRELVLIGSPDDATWGALDGITDPRLLIMETAAPPGIRDANYKRDLGIRQTSGDLICLLDSDMVIPPNWMSTAVALLDESKADCVAGVMRSVHDDFWGRFVDTTRLGAKTPGLKAHTLSQSKTLAWAGANHPSLRTFYLLATCTSAAQ